jgi:hypothetical protein
MNRKQLVFEFARMQVPVDLSGLPFKPIKTAADFIRGYKLHDIACRYAEDEYVKSGFTLYRIGADLRNRRVMVRNEVPDYFAERGEEQFCFDVKGKTLIDFFGEVNERAVISYRRLAASAGVLVYVNFILIQNSKVVETGHADVMSEPIGKKPEWNGNPVWIYKWERGLARLPPEV